MTTDDRRLGVSDVARSDLISWSSIVAGVVTAFGLFVLFGAISVAAGLESADTPYKYGEVVGSIIAGLLGVLAFGAGGFVAVWCTRRRSRLGNHTRVPRLGAVRGPAGADDLARCRSCPRFVRGHPQHLSRSADTRPNPDRGLGHCLRSRNRGSEHDPRRVAGDERRRAAALRLRSLTFELRSRRGLNPPAPLNWRGDPSS